MAMRMSGMMSGMDTESIIQQLVEARSTKLNTTKKAQIKVNWKQDAWKDLNTKLKNLQSRFISNMRFSTAYSKKTTKVSNSSVVSVITGEDAVNGVQSLKVKQLAKTGYLTGAELKNGTVKGDYTAMTKLSELGVTGDGTFSVMSSKGSVDINVNGDTTISDVLNKLKDAGLNASFDTKTQRFFVSAKDSGVANDFSITASNANGSAALSALGLQVNLNEDKASLAKYKEYAGYYVSGDRDQTLDNMKSMIDADVESGANAYLGSYNFIMQNIKASEDRLKELQDQRAEADEPGNPATDDDRKALDEGIAAMQKHIDGLNAQAEDIVGDASKGKVGYINLVPEVDADGNTTYSATATDKLIGEVEDRYYDKAEYAALVMSSYDDKDTTGTGATKVSGQDAIISLNGADFTNNTNVFEINGLTFTALSETAENETVTVTTQNDTDGIYDMIKGFLKEYNSIINEMDKLYNAASAKGYEPLLSEEKEVMSDNDVEEYEKKIKDSLLRGDRNLSSISSALKGIMSGGIEINGKKMYLSDFGISTLGYFNAPDNEKNAYHIDGDADDADTAGNADKLKGMISGDPDTVISFFTQLSKDLHAKMTDLSSSVKGYRSFGSFYDDKKMQSDYDGYTTKINTLQQKLNAYEDKWYSKFAKMETAMAKMQKNANAISGLLGGL